MFFLCSFSFSLCAALCDAFPLTALFAGVFLAFLVIFSPSCCNCFRRGKGKVKGKGKDAVKSVRNEPKCTRYERKDESDCGTHTIESSTNLPHFNLKMMTKGRISIICMTENISRICTSLRLKYTQDPFLFSEYVTHDELSSHSNGADITCTGVVKAGGISVIAVYGCGSKWAAFPSNSSVLESDNVDGNIDDISSNNNIKDGNIDLLNNRNQNNDENRLEEERKNASHITADMNTNINTSSSASDSAVRVELDAWLDRILGGICPSVRTVDQPIPYILGINEEIIR